MQLYIIRHAQSVNNALYARTHSDRGRLPDPPLTDIGQQQATLLAEYLVQQTRPTPPEERDFHNHTGFHLTHLYCSLMLRAVQTGTAVAQTTNLPLHGWPAIHERGGIYHTDETSGKKIGLPGKNRAYFQEHFPHLILPDNLDERGWWQNRPYESLTEEVPSRAKQVWQQLITRHGGTEDRVAIVSHGGFFSSLLQVLLRYMSPNPIVEPPRDIWFRMNNVSISRFDIHAYHMEIIYLNRVTFLPAHLVT